MSASTKRNAIVVALLAVFFYWAFMFAKHAPALRNTIPFGVDPYDAVGSFAVIAAALIVPIALFRAFRRYRAVPPPAAQLAYCERTFVSIVALVFVTVASDVVAMARHAGSWINAPSRNELLLLLGALAVAAGAVRILIAYSKDAVAHHRSPADRRNAMLIMGAAMLALAIYPEHVIQNIWLHLLTIIAGAAILFASVRALVIMSVPLEVVPATPDRPAKRTTLRRWSVLLIVAVVVGLAAFAGEMSEGTTPPAVKLLFVALVFVTLTVSGLAIAYGFLGTALGLGRRTG
ncbi:MAG TPA: hypothetical protein VHU41_18590 [Thermoanaerobaculia bacterium]|nr:hypothetical protein [Thermoanaerobaculia bacterium]